MERSKVFTASLLEWIENNIESSLPLDFISQKSGYSKWHVQRIFKKNTGLKIADYIRKRKISKAALAIKLTDSTIYDIALEFGYDSQQTFTRAFKKYFLISPGAYRKSDTWDFSKFLPSLLEEQVSIENPELKEITCTPGKMLNIFEVDLWKLESGKTNILEEYIGKKIANENQYLLDFIKGNKSKTISIVVRSGEIKEHKIHKMIPRGKVINNLYLKFNFYGSSTEIDKKIKVSHTIYLSQTSLLRKSAYDITVVRSVEVRTGKENIYTIDYYMPVTPKIPLHE